MADESTVYIVDDDRDMRESLKWLLESVNLSVRAFASAEEFLTAHTDANPGCMLLDVRMPGMGGLRLIEHLQSVHSHLPVIMFTAYGDVPMAVRAMKAGAFDFIEKTAAHQLILERVQLALTADKTLRLRELERAKFGRLLKEVSPREHEVMIGMIEGKPSKVIASDLGLSERTVEKHRKSVMDKMQVRSLADLIRLFCLYGDDVAAQ